MNRLSVLSLFLFSILLQVFTMGWKDRIESVIETIPQ